ncbi:cell division protein CrgA [Mobilicoccus pelagius]|uniref:Cell division protein CrgA n=1 Tax=Mobilicoccus pelagius NBRC 104925 TaxID=1089455 RepID=H5USU7_9MICO|nr:hypothetical protein MOPEL_083_00100 [Mobilicoccus pelagius NBRC 104925]
MPSSKMPKKSTDGATTVPVDVGPKPNPSWYVPVMVGLMVLGLLWIVVFYLTAGTFPVQPWGNWNLAAGFGLIIAGFLMTTNWR